MAVRDRNLFAWQAYVITMAFISVGLMLGMFFLWRSYADLTKRNTDMSTQLSEARDQYTKANARVTRLKAMMGYGEHTSEELAAMAQAMAADEQLSDVERDFAEKMKLFAKTEKESGKNLMELSSHLMDTIRLRNEEIARARKREEQLQQDQQAVIERETTARKDAQDKMNEAQQLLDTERKTHADQVASLNKEKDEITKKFDENKAVFDRQLTSLTAKNTEMATKVKNQEATIADQQEIIKRFREDDYAAPQGEIIRVANGGQEVWINIGSEDGLREGVPFSVIDASTVKVTKASPKARLQITRVIDAHLSVAKAIEYDFRKPIVTGDKVYSPAWRSGRKVGFALVGAMDVNGDLVDDSEMVKDLIVLSGGRIDAILDSKGSLDGKLGVGTSFIVLGADTSISEGVNAAQLTADRKERLEKYAGFINDAKGFGATQMSLDNLMGYLKSNNSDRIVPLGNRIRGDDFSIPEDPNPPVSQGSVSDVFKRRNP